MTQLPPQNKNKASLPDSFGDFSNCRVIIDCTEFHIGTQRKDLLAASASYSTYKHFLFVNNRPFAATGHMLRYCSTTPYWRASVSVASRKQRISLCRSQDFEARSYNFTLV